MSHENKPDWNDLQNEQAETNAWQIDRIWITAKKLPLYFWVTFILLTATLLNTLRLHYVMQDMVKAENQKTEMNRDLALKYHKNRSEREAGLREQIEHLNEVIENHLEKESANSLHIQHLQKQIQLKQIGKQFYHAVANELGGSSKDRVNYHLNKMFSNDYGRAILIKDDWIVDALELGAIHSAEGIGKRIELVKNKEKFEAIARMSEIIKENPKAWEDFINKNNNLPKRELGQ